MIQKVYDF